MDIKEYISSGILELYVLGSLSENENREVEEVIKNNPQVKPELELIQKTIYLSAGHILKTPHERVKSNLFHEIGKTQSSSAATIRSEKTTGRETAGYYRYLMAASIAFLFLSLGANYFLWRKLKDANNEIAVLSDQKKVMVQEYESVSRKLTKHRRTCKS